MRWKMKSVISQKNPGKQTEYKKYVKRIISPSPLACDDPAQPIIVIKIKGKRNLKTKKKADLEGKMNRSRSFVESPKKSKPEAPPARRVPAVFISIIFFIYFNQLFIFLNNLKEKKRSNYSILYLKRGNFLSLFFKQIWNRN